MFFTDLSLSISLCCVTICVPKWLLSPKQHPLVPPPPCQGPEQQGAGTNHVDTGGSVTTVRKWSDIRWIYVIGVRWLTILNKCYHFKTLINKDYLSFFQENLYIHIILLALSWDDNEQKNWSLLWKMIISCVSKQHSGVKVLCLIYKYSWLLFF